jgi:hypothetical protein
MNSTPHTSQRSAFDGASQAGAEGVVPPAESAWASLRQGARRWWPHGLAILALALVYLAYTQPDFVIAVANEVWSCF